MKPVNTGNAEHYRWGSESDGWHLLKSDSMSVIEERVSPGGAEVRHVHSSSQQFFYVLSGTATLEISGEIHQVEAGSGIHVPPGTPHQLNNQGDSDLRFLVISQPPSHDDRIEV